jgi:protease IV
MNETVKKPGIFTRIGNGLTRTRLILSNLFFFGFLLLALILLFSGVPTPQVPERGALVLNPEGSIVERRSSVDPIQQWLAPQSVLGETELGDLLETLRHARDDDRIPMVVLDLDDLQFVSLAHANAIADALGAVRDAGKEVVAYGSLYDQQTYLMVSQADAIYMHPLGQVMLPGYSINQLYFKDLLDKLGINVHIFQAGRYKDFIEPYMRSDMSADSREANRELIDELWRSYADRVMDNRRLEADRFRRYTQSYPDALTEADGDFARLAVEYHLVDELLTPDQARARIADAVGRSKRGDFNGIGFRDYLQAVNATKSAASGDAQIGVITAQGPVMMGDELRGVIASDRLVQMIRQARDDDTVRALVLRLNTPGGSAFASEIIRQELELTQLAGKPVVVSMGPVAASGGYWIAATADAIFAEPTTLTGSIGVFGILPTFEESLSAIGVESDGVRTSDLSPMDLLSGLSDASAQIMQAGAEHTYQRFTNLVARGRDMTPEQVENVAQGRVWLGTRALNLGLVDALGGQAEAISRAAELANLTEYGVRTIAPAMTPRERLLQQLFGGSVAASVGTAALGWFGDGSVLPGWLRQVDEARRLALTLNDPRHAYALCLTCRVVD